jgi:hypothetical protein
MYNKTCSSFFFVVKDAANVIHFYYANKISAKY